MIINNSTLSYLACTRRFHSK